MPVAHRVTGFALLALTVPVAVHCLIAYGVQLTSPRVAIHSVSGCFFYGAFAAKILLVHSRRMPGWALLAAGGTLSLLLWNIPGFMHTWFCVTQLAGWLCCDEVETLPGLAQRVVKQPRLHGSGTGRRTCDVPIKRNGRSL